MMNNININKKDQIDLNRLIETRLLIQANSGGGKSWLIRRLLEQSHGKVQQIVIDLEGEFSTLREKYDYILAGKSGDTVAEPRSAAMLARRLLELNVSAIIDLYELNAYDRKSFVKNFLDAMVNAPKNLWHPCLVVIDEAHVFAPEKGQSEALGAVIDLATRGRKRGYCAVLATQRLSKLHKDAAAECNNKLIGRTGLDVDMKRASEELGFTSKDDYYSLRKLESGEFFAFGPAISNEVKKVQVGDVQTTHPTVGGRIIYEPTPPTKKIKSLLSKLGDLPKEAEEEAKTVAELKAQVIDLKRNPIQVAVNEDDIKRAVDQAVRQERQKTNKVLSGQQKVIKQMRGFIGMIGEKASEFADIQIEEIDVIVPTPVYSQLAKRTPEVNESFKILLPQDQGDVKITGGALRMLKVLASRYPTRFTKTQLATFSRLKSSSGTYGTYMSTLRGKGLIEMEGNLVNITQEGLDYVGEMPNPPQSTGEVIEMWRNNLNGGAKRMFEVLAANQGLILSKDELAEKSGLVSTSGTFGTYLSILKSNGLIEVNQEGITISNNLFI